MHNEGSKQCIVPGYAKSKLKDCDNIDFASPNANRTTQNQTNETIPGGATCNRRSDGGGSARDPRQQTTGPDLGPEPPGSILEC